MYHFGAPMQNPPTSRLVSVTVLPGHKLEVRFEDGTNGIVEMHDFVMGNEADYFEVLRDGELFSKVQLKDGIPTWPGEIDISPAMMYDEIKKKGKWVL